MTQKLKTMKVTQETLDNFKASAALLGKKQYEVAEYASKEVWNKVEKKFMGKKKSSSKTK